MTFGLDARTLERLVLAVSDTAALDTASLDTASLDTATGAAPQVEARFAGAAWSALVEPGDGTAGALIAALGATQALTALVEQWTLERIVDAVHGIDAADAQSLAPELADAVKRWRPRLRSAEVVRALEQAARVGARLVVPGDAGWPKGLDDLGRHAPLVLWRRGSAEIRQAANRSIALVGARAATGYGEHVTMEASAGLVQRGFAIVSGAAYGIDGMAHRAALASSGATIAILAGGVDRFYPSGHDALLARIADVGAVLSEVPCGAAPTKWRFLQRNRLIAAVAEATVVVEAGRRSGSLNTAGHAAALGRPLGAVPGPVTSPASAGCHRLIRDYDAVCVTNVEEMVELVDGPAADSALQQATGDPTSVQTRVIDALSARSPRAVHDIAARAGLAAATVTAVLGTFQLDGIVDERQRGWVLSRRASS